MSETTLYWQRFGADYRAQEVKQILGWVQRWECGSIIGLPGSGRASLIDFLAFHEGGRTQLPADMAARLSFVPLDLNQLPDETLATFYRTLQRAIFERRAALPEALSREIETIYRKSETSQDAFFVQSGLREFLYECQELGHQLVFLLNRFDEFCGAATSQMLQTLLNLRDHFRDTILYLVGSRRELRYSQGIDHTHPLYQLLDTHRCWAGPLSPREAIGMIRRRLAGVEAEMVERACVYLPSLTGRFPALLRASCQLVAQGLLSDDGEQWPEQLLANGAVHFRLERIWRNLTTEEQAYLLDPTALPPQTAHGEEIKQRLHNLGLLTPNAAASETLLTQFARRQPGLPAGRIWFDSHSGELYQGSWRLDDLTPQEAALLRNFVLNSGRRLTYTMIADAVWDVEKAYVDTISPNTIQVAVGGLRRRLARRGGQTAYIVSFRDVPEGGYQFFPEGRPS